MRTNRLAPAEHPLELALHRAMPPSLLCPAKTRPLPASLASRPTRRYSCERTRRKLLEMWNFTTDRLPAATFDAVSAAAPPWSRSISPGNMVYVSRSICPGNCCIVPISRRYEFFYTQTNMFREVDQSRSALFIIARGRVSHQRTTAGIRA